eukprot:GHVT01104985.1.p2 GENE.GHVT01104985.1~~GHVT01104985.1.p2  ORF type:complete len:218 (+),score=35.45 GHVT01104985.1:1550-2203(+)
MDIKDGPCLLILDASDGKVLTSDGLQWAKRDPRGLCFPWSGAAHSRLRRWLTISFEKLPLALILILWAWGTVRSRHQDSQDLTPLRSGGLHKPSHPDDASVCAPTPRLFPEAARSPVSTMDVCGLAHADDSPKRQATAPQLADESAPLVANATFAHMQPYSQTTRKENAAQTVSATSRQNVRHTPDVDQYLAAHSKLHAEPHQRYAGIFTPEGIHEL